MVAKPKKMGHRFYRYPIDFIVVRPAGIEPAAYCLGGNRSIRLSYGRGVSPEGDTTELGS